MPPPSKAPLEEISQWMTVNQPSLQMPPPRSPPKFPERMQWLPVSVWPFWIPPALKIPPPAWEPELPDRTQLRSVPSPPPPLNHIPPPSPPPLPYLRRPLLA